MPTCCGTRVAWSTGKAAHPARVYVCEVPLDGFEVVHTVLGKRYPAAASHAMVLVELQDLPGCHCFDFLPEHTRSWRTAAFLVCGRGVPGVRRYRLLKRKPTRRCWSVGMAIHEDPLAEAEAFQSAWDDELRLFRNDCRRHAASLASHLTGVERKQVLLRRDAWP